MEHHIAPTDHYHDHTHTVYTKPVDATPKFQFLAYNNYLNEFKSEVDKARVRFNLGIPDQFSFNWGNIQGSIEEQQDLIEFINTKTEGTQRWKTSIDTKIQDINTQIGLLSNRLEGTASSTEVDTLSNSLNQVRTEINKLWTDVADNSRELTTLYKLVSGESIDTSFVSQINQNTNNIVSISNRLQAVEQRPALDPNINTRLLALEARQDQDTIYDDTALVTEINNLKARIEQLQREVGSNTLTDLIVSKSTWEVSPTSDNIPITITARYTQLKDKDVTELCTAVSSNRNIITWNSENHEIEISDGIEETSTATITFTYGELSVVVTVTVKTMQPVISKSYVGWGQEYTQLLGNSNFECDTVAKKWNNAPSIGTSPYYFFIITSQEIATISSSVGPYNINELFVETIPYNGTNYNVYKIGPARNTSAEINITI